MELKRYQSDYYEDVMNYVQSKELLTFTGRPKEAIVVSATTPTHHSIVVYEKNQLVCFFALDEGEAKQQYTSEIAALVLRSFSTDSRYLRLGYAKNTLLLLPSFVREQFPEIKEIVLGVNQKNLPAQSLYQKVGFVENGRVIIGPKGPQRVLVYTLES